MQLTNGDTISAIQNLRRVAIGQFELGFANESEITAVKALKFLDRLERNSFSREATRGLLNHLGMVYRKLGLFDKALSYYEDALELAKNSSDSIPLINNISNIYLEQKRYEEAIKNFSFVYEERLKQNNFPGTARALDNLGFARSKIGHPEALQNMRSALKIREQNGDIPGMYASYHHLAKFYDQLDRPEEALLYTNMSYDVAKSLNSATYIENALSLLLDLSDDSRVKEYRKLTDSLAQARQMQENKYAVIKYNVAQEKQKTHLAELQKEKEQRLRILYQGIGIIILLTAAFILLLMRSKFKKDKIQQVYKTETRISKKIHDELSNDVYKVMAQLEHDPADPSAVDQLQHIYRQTRNISRENNPIDTGDGFQEELSAMLSGYIPANAKLILKGLESINWQRISGEKKVVLYRVLQELMTNMNKHSKASFIAITFDMLQRSLKIGYADNGVGMARKPGFPAGGLRNAENRISSVRGSFTFGTSEGKGFNAEIRIPG
jgi:signal transduction histidine kinase